MKNNFLFLVFVAFILSCKNPKEVKQEHINLNEVRSSYTYKEVLIGETVWMGENLNVSHYSDGTPISRATTNEDWMKALVNKESVWFFYENNPDNEEKYGKLYNWHAVIDARGLCPKGWRMPEKEDFDNLLNNVGKNSSEFFNSLKEGGTSGFNATAGGWSINFYHFYYIDSYAYYWSSTINDRYYVWVLRIDYGRENVELISNEMDVGFSVRCVKAKH